MSSYRIITLIAIFICLLVFPWWIGALLSFVALIYFEDFYEFLAFGFLIDLFYAPEDGLYKFLFLTISLLIFILVTFVKDKVRL